MNVAANEHTLINIDDSSNTSSNENSISCPICFEDMKNTTRIQLHCCNQILHFKCFSKCLPKCPFCRALQPQLIPVYIVKTDWPKVFKKITVCIIISTFATICSVSSVYCNKV